MKQHSLLEFANSDSDDSFGVRVGVPKIVDKMPAAKKPRGRAAANRVAKPEPKTTTRRAGAKKATAAEKDIERLALADKPANEGTKATKGRKTKQTVDAVGDEAEDVMATPPASDEPAQKKTGRGRPKKDAVVPDSVQKEKAPVAAKKGRKPAKVPDPVLTDDEPSEIPETQQAEDMMEVDVEEDDQVEDLPVFSRYSVPPSAQRKGSFHVPLSASKRSASVPDHESDPSVRRRLGELAKKYEALEARYKDLKNVGVMEAERTFDQLRRTSEERTQGKSCTDVLVARVSQSS